LATTFARRLSSWQAKIAARGCLRGKRKTPYLIANAPAAYVVANLPEARCNGVLAAGFSDSSLFKKPATLSFQLIREFSTVGKAVQILIQTTAAYRQ
jgi:hypothetical protein